MLMQNKTTLKIYLVITTILMLNGAGRHLLQARPPDSTVTMTPTQTQPSTPSYMDLVRNFDYNSKAPLDVQEKLVEQIDSLKLIEISFINPRRWRVVADMLEPVGPGPYAGLIYLCGNQNDRLAFMDEARSLAQTGTIVLIIDTSARQIETNAIRQSVDNSTIQTVIDIRRAVDLLLVQPAVDPRRIGFIGQAMGADLGGIVAGVEKRIRALALISCNSRPSAVDSKATPSTFLDGKHYIGYGAPAALLFQYCEKNDLLPKSVEMELFQAASQPKTLNWYGTNPLTDSQARADRLTWLCGQLGMISIP
ncbi:MAG: hypothetical protein V1681_10805 [Candidatus Neomarinimicrobiota bacterium]